MKHLNKLFAVTLLSVGIFVNAQDGNNTWTLSFGINAMDTRVSAASSFEDQMSHYFKFKDNWNYICFSYRYYVLA